MSSDDFISDSDSETGPAAVAEEGRFSRESSVASSFSKSKSVKSLSDYSQTCESLVRKLAIETDSEDSRTYDDIQSRNSSTAVNTESKNSSKTGSKKSSSKTEFERQIVSSTLASGVFGACRRESLPIRLSPPAAPTCTNDRRYSKQTETNTNSYNISRSRLMNLQDLKPDYQRSRLMKLQNLKPASARKTLWRTPGPLPAPILVPKAAQLNGIRTPVKTDNYQKLLETTFEAAVDAKFFSQKPVSRSVEVQTDLPETKKSKKKSEVRPKKLKNIEKIINQCPVYGNGVLNRPPTPYVNGFRLCSCKRPRRSPNLHSNFTYPRQNITNNKISPRCNCRRCGMNSFSYF